MFTNLKNRVSAAETIMHDLEWTKKNAYDTIKAHEDEPLEWSESVIAETKALLDGIEAVEKALAKFVKEAM